MMATAAVIGLSTGKRLLSSSFYYSDITEKLSSYVNEHSQFASVKNVIVSRKSSNYSPTSFPFSNQQEQQSIRALKEHVVDTASDPSTAQPWFQESNDLEEEASHLGYSVEALLLLQKSMLEKQWNLSFESKVLPDVPRVKKSNKKTPVTCSGVSARQRRMTAKKKTSSKSTSFIQPATANHVGATISPELLQNRLKGYVKGVISEELLTHAEVVRLSKKIKIGLSLEQQKSR